MANLNKVLLIGRLTRDPEPHEFANGGRVVKFGFAVNNKKKNQQTGQYEDDPVFLDCEAFNRGENGKLADLVEQYLHKGSQAHLEGHLKLDKWQDKTTGENRQKLKVVVDQVQFLDPKPQDGNGQQPQRTQGRQQQRQQAQPAGGYYDDADAPAPNYGSDDDGQIPF
jgi:single-strand DNA-binding protein